MGRRQFNDLFVFKSKINLIISWHALLTDFKKGDVLSVINFFIMCLLFDFVIDNVGPKIMLIGWKSVFFK